MSGRHVGRRHAAAGGFAMLLLAASAAGSAKAEELDGELIQMCREFATNEAEFDRLCDFEADGHDARALIRTSVDRCHELRALIARTSRRERSTGKTNV